MRNSTGTTIEISWDAPENNNSTITKYNVYMSNSVIQNIGNSNLVSN